MVENENNNDSVENAKMLIESAKAGDSEAFGTLYQLYYTPVYRYIYLRTKSKTQAEDITQTVFLKVYKTLGRWEATESSPLAYFFTVARNSIIDHWRKESHGTVYDDEVVRDFDGQEGSAVDDFEKRETEEIVHSALGILTEDQQEVMRLKFISDLSTAEIARMLDKSEEAVRQLQSRALKLLRTYFKRES
jgi:RNA polymerase sigma-70 factor (ECF subfamily)